MSPRNFSPRSILDRFSTSEGILLLVLATVVGSATGLAAVFFIRLIFFIQTFSYSTAQSLFPHIGTLAFVFIPVLGALIVGPLIAFFAKEAKGHGVPEVMQALVSNGGRIRPRVAIAKIAASALCIGTGGSAGREGPIVQVGATLGSSFGQYLGLSDDRIKNLVACGAAAGIAATFNAPIAGVAFAIEVLMCGLQVRMFGNVVVAAVSASIVSQVFLGARPAFAVPAYTMPSLWAILFYLVLGLIAALVGIMFIRMLNWFEDIFDGWNFPLFLKPAVGALLLGLLGFTYLNLPGIGFKDISEFQQGMPLIENIPHMFGSGFVFIEDALQGNASFWLLGLLVLLKPLATSFTLGSGNSGGVFAPSLFIGAMLGGFLGNIYNGMFPSVAGEVGAYALVGMAAVFSATARAPLTAMLIVFEMSNDYFLILPLMVAGVAASSFAHWLHPESIYTLKLVKRGIHFFEGRDLDIMQSVLVEEVMNKKPITVRRDQPLAELYARFQETRFLGFPVMEKGRLWGIVTLQDMERILSEEGVKIRELSVSDVAIETPITVYPDEPIWAAIQKMSPRDLARLPVVSRDGSGRLLGLISRSDILRAYDVGIVRKQRGQVLEDHTLLRKSRQSSFIEFRLKENENGVGKRLIDLPIPEDVNLVSVERGSTIIIPRGETVFQIGDVITAFGRNEGLAKIEDIFHKELPDTDTAGR